MSSTKFALTLVSCLLAGALSPVSAYEIRLYVDSAPNAYGSPDYAPWWTQAKSAAADGSFINMKNSLNPLNAGTTCFDLRDEVVYGFGDLGRRLHFVYWIPEATIGGLMEDSFQIGMDYVWDGVKYDFYDEYFGSTWLTPGKWEEFAGGVIGTAGFAWWGAYGIDTLEALAADLAAWEPSAGDVTLHTRVGEGQTVSLTACRPVPETTSTVGLLGLGIVAVAAFSRRYRA